MGWMCTGFASRFQWQSGLHMFPVPARTNCAVVDGWSPMPTHIWNALMLPNEENESLNLLLVCPSCASQSFLTHSHVQSSSTMAPGGAKPKTPPTFLPRLKTQASNFGLNLRDCCRYEFRLLSSCCHSWTTFRRKSCLLQKPASRYFEGRLDASTCVPMYVRICGYVHIDR